MWEVLVVCVVLGTTQALEKCLLSEFPVQKVLFGDQLSYNLDARSEGTEISFKVDSHDLQGKVWVEPAFDKTDKPQQISFGFTKCQSFSQGNLESDIVVLCDDRYLGFLRYNLYTGILETQQKMELSTNLNCHVVAHSDYLGMLFVLCTKINTGATVMLSIKSDSKVLKSEVEIALKAGEKQLDFESVEIEVYESKDSGVLVTNIVVYEQKQTPRIIFLQSTSEKLVIQGIYRLQDGNILNAPEKSILHDCQLVSESLLLTFEVDTKTVLMTYEPTPRQGSLKFKDESEPKLALPFLKGGFMVLNQDRLIAVSSNKLLYCDFDLEELDCDTAGITSIDLPTGLFYSVKDVIASKEDIYLLGFDQTGGSVTYRHKDGGVIQYVSRPAASGYKFSIIKRDVYDSSFEIQILLGPQSTVFTVLKDNILHIDTSKFQGITDDKFSVNIECYLGSKIINTKTVSLTLWQGPEYNPSISVQNLIHYTLWTKSLKSEIDHPSIRFNGNAPTVTTNDSVTSIDHVKEFDDPLWKGEAITDISTVTYIGDGLYVFDTTQYIYFMECKASQFKSGECSGPIFPKISTFSRKFMAARSYGDKIVYVQFSSGSNTTTVSIITKSGRSLSEATYNSRTDAVAVRFLNTYVDIVFVGNFPWTTDMTGHFFALRINPSDGSRLPAEKDILMALPLSSHICPKELSFSPDMQTLFVTSVCGDKSKNPDNHVIMMSLNLESAFPKERITVNNTYRIADSTDFSVCPHRQNFALIDTIKRKISVYSESDNIFRLMEYPLEYYGFTNVISWSCDSRRNFVQVIAQRPDKSFGLLSYRIDLIDDPTKRVHSVVELSTLNPSRQVSDLRSIVTYTSIEEDRFYSLMFGKSSSDFRVMHMRLNPSVVINTKAISSKSYATVEFKAKYPGRNGQAGTEASLTHTFVFASPDLELNKVPLDNRQGKKVGYHEDIDLDTLVSFTAPVVRVTANDPSFTMTTRCPKHDLVNTPKVLWSAVRLYQDYSFGYTESKLDGLWTVYLYKDTNMITKVTFKRILDIKILSRAGDKPLFVGHSLADDSTGQLFIFNEKLQGFQVLPLRLRGFTKCVINRGLGDSVVTTVYNALYNQSIFVYTAVLQKTGDWLLSDGPSTLLPSMDNFDAVVVSDTLVVLSQLHYTRATQIDMFKLYAPEVRTDGNLVRQFKTGLFELTGKRGRSARQPVFACTRQTELDWGIQCVVGGPDVKELLMFSFEIIPDQNTGSVVKNVVLLRTLSNIWNLVPIKAVMTQNYTAIIANNTRPKDSSTTKEEGDLPLFEAKSLVLLYRTDLSPSGGIDKALPPYMIFNPDKLFENNNSQDSDLLDAIFFRVERGANSLKLAIVAGGRFSSPEPITGSARIKAFSTSGLLLKPKSQKAINPQAVLTFEGVNYGNGTSSQHSVSLEDLVAFTASGNSPKLKLLLWGVIGSLVVLAIVFTLYCVLSPSASKLAGSSPSKEFTTTAGDSVDHQYYSFTRT